MTWNFKSAERKNNVKVNRRLIEWETLSVTYSTVQGLISEHGKTSTIHCSHLSARMSLEPWRVWNVYHIEGWMVRHHVSVLWPGIDSVLTTTYCCKQFSDEGSVWYYLWHKHEYLEESLTTRPFRKAIADTILSKNKKTNKSSRENQLHVIMG